MESTVNKIKKKSLLHMDESLKCKIGMSILLSYLQVFDTFYYMNSVINVSNTKTDQLWSLEKNYNPLHTIFILANIECENIQEDINDLVFKYANARVGDKNFKDRAKEILLALKEKVVFC